MTVHISDARVSMKNLKKKLIKLTLTAVNFIYSRLTQLLTLPYTRASYRTLASRKCIFAQDTENTR